MIKNKLGTSQLFNNLLELLFASEMVLVQKKFKSMENIVIALDGFKTNISRTRKIHQLVIYRRLQLYCCTDESGVKNCGGYKITVRIKYGDDFSRT